MKDKLIIEAIESFVDFSKILLFELAEKCKIKKDIYLRNAIAKNASILESILNLFKMGNYYDGWILYRALSDRLAHVYYLERNNYYEDFEKWTFIRDFEDNNRARSDINLKKSSIDNFKTNKEQQTKYSNYKIENPQWKRPDVKKILKDENLFFIYKYGYDYASKHTHPMYTDGMFEFYKFTGLEPNPYRNITKLTLLSNSLLLATISTQMCLNFHTLRFRVLVYSYLEGIICAIEGDSNSFKIAFVKVAELFEKKISLCD